MKKIACILLCLSFCAPALAAQRKIDKKLQIVIPRVRLKNVTAEQALAYIQRLSREMDVTGEGINIIYVRSKKESAKRVKKTK